VRRIPTRASLVENVRIGNVCRKLLRVCRRGENPEDAWDLLQEAYVKFLEVTRKSPVANEEAYLKTVIRNIRSAMWRERRKREATLLALEELLEQPDEVSGGHPASGPSPEEQAEWLKKAIESLSPRLRETIELDMGGFSNEQIAGRLGIEMTTVKKHLSRARAHVELIMLQEAEHADK
jgi:RNA polymerase sigma factor (sigma-70 family)